MQQLDKTSKAPFQLYLSNCMILRQSPGYVYYDKANHIPIYKVLQRSRSIFPHGTQHVKRYTMVKYTKGNTYTPLKHKVSTIMGGITVKFIPYSSGNVQKWYKGREWAKWRKLFLLILCSTHIGLSESREPGVINPVLDMGFSRKNMNPFTKTRCTTEFLNERSPKNRG